MGCMNKYGCKDYDRFDRFDPRHRDRGYQGRRPGRDHDFQYHRRCRSCLHDSPRYFR